jgi:hypothetical protein
MHLERVIFIPTALIQFTEEEISALFLASAAHYDGVCRQASQPGGVLWGLRNRLHDGIAQAEISHRDLDLLGKVAEQLDLTHRDNPGLVARIRYNSENSFSAILRKLNDEYDRINR